MGAVGLEWEPFSPRRQRQDPSSGGERISVQKLTEFLAERIIDGRVSWLTKGTYPPEEWAAAMAMAQEWEERVWR